MKAHSISTKIGASLSVLLAIAAGLAAFALCSTEAGWRDRLIVGGCGGVVLLAALVAAVSLRRGVAAPLGRLAAAVGRLAGGDLSVAVGGVERQDEIGRMAAALEGFRASLVERARLARRSASATTGSGSGRRPSKGWSPNSTW